MKYIEATIYTSIYGIEPVTELLDSMDVTGVVIENPEDVDQLMEKKNSYDWDYVDPAVLSLRDREPNVRFYLEHSKDGYKKLEEIRIRTMMLKGQEYEGNLPAGKNLGRMYLEEVVVDDSDWKDNWKEYFKVTRITNRIVIKPSWENYEKENSQDLIIEIDPGMAFGTGTHATTSLCLKLTEKYLKPGDKVLDVGCGSGILSIAGALLGAGQVLGVDIDPAAVPIAEENVALNGLSHLVEIRQGDLTKGLDFTADLVLGNLMADLVMLLSDDVASHLSEEGLFVSSGILTEKRDQVANHMESRGFEILEVLEQDEWCAIAAKRKK